MVLFVADNHYGARPGYALHQELKDDYAVDFYEDTLICFRRPLCEYQLIVLNMIAGTGDGALPSAVEEKHLEAYVKRGGSLLLLHGGSAAFWPWSWWRKLVAYRWVRPDDPDGVTPSEHPIRPFQLNRAKSRHPLVSQLQPATLPADEIYIHLEQTAPLTALMVTTTDEGTFIQCYESMTEYGGRVVGFLPGHAKSVVRHPAMVANCRCIIDYLLKPHDRTGSG